MKLIAQLNKPYTFQEKQNFILKYSRKLNCEIKHTDEGIEAWGYTEEEKLLSAKELKLSEALSKAYEYENKTGFVTFEGRPVEYNNQAEDNIIQKLSIELFNQSKFFQLLIAFSQGLLEEDFIYSTKEDVNVYINALEAKGIYTKITEALTKLWTIDYPAFKQQINAAESIEEIDLIKIDYANNEEERN